MAADLVIDADGHCMEPTEDMTPWMPREFHDRAPVVFKDRTGASATYVEGRLSTKHGPLGPGVTGPFAPHIKGGRPGEHDAAQRLPDRAALLDRGGAPTPIATGRTACYTRLW